MPHYLRNAWNLVAGLVPFRRRRERPRPASGVPPWAEAGRKRRAHIRRVATLLREWADAMDASPEERERWLKACWLHDALRDADLPSGVTHGAAAADRAASDGEVDAGVLCAVRYHSVGHGAWDDVGKMLYLADYLEPGRKRRSKQRAEMARRVPTDRDGVLREILAQHIRTRLRRGRAIDPHTVAFWNSLA